MIKIFVALIAFVIPAKSFAAACCSGNSVLPSLITADNRAQLSTSLISGSVIGDVDSLGQSIFRSQQNLESTQTLKMDFSYQMSELWQMGVTLPINSKTRSITATSAQYTGLGDTALFSAYEVLPERSYSPWKPRLFVFTQLTVPTAPSIYEQPQNLGVSAVGAGFWTPSFGLMAVKVKGPFDFFAMAEGHHSLNRTTRDSSTGDTLQLSPGWGGSLSAGLGFSPGASPWRLGLSLAPTYESELGITSASGNSPKAYQLVWNASTQVSYVINPEYGVTASYVDQTLVGPVHNVSISRTFSLRLDRRWSL